MRKRFDTESVSEKERIRTQISAQVDEFLRNGGQIENCSRKQIATNNKSVGGVWHSPNEILSMVED